jgi:Spy/CpxP family protein refolding chaperone
MNRKRTTLLAAALIALLALPALAMEAPTTGATGVIAALVNKPGILVQVLKLTKAQTDTLKGLIQTLQTTVKTERTANDALDKQIQTALTSLAPDNCAIGKLVITRHQNELALVAAFTKFDKDFSAILTPDQLARYQKLKNAFGHLGDKEAQEEG